MWGSNSKSAPFRLNKSIAIMVWQTTALPHHGVGGRIKGTYVWPVINKRQNCLRICFVLMTEIIILKWYTS